MKDIWSLWMKQIRILVKTYNVSSWCTAYTCVVCPPTGHAIETTKWTRKDSEFPVHPNTLACICSCWHHAGAIHRLSSAIVLPMVVLQHVLFVLGSVLPQNWTIVTRSLVRRGRKIVKELIEPCLVWFQLISTEGRKIESICHPSAFFSKSFLNHWWVRPSVRRWAAGLSVYVPAPPSPGLCVAYPN